MTIVTSDQLKHNDARSERSDVVLCVDDSFQGPVFMQRQSNEI